MQTFKALLVTQTDGKSSASFQDLGKDALPSGDVLIRIAYSSLNYKDGLAVTGRPGVIRKYPMVPGVDFAGVVEETTSTDFRVGDNVVVTGCGTSEVIWGGYAQYARIAADFVVPLPKKLSLKQAMGIGTAGFTAMQSVIALERQGLRPEGKEVLVTGAAGGLGSIAIAVLAKLGYIVVASTGRPELHDYLRDLGASEVIDRAVLSAPSKRAMDTERWAAAIDSAGGETLAGALKSMASGASLAACGLAASATLNTTVFPFILRGVNLLGINSVTVPNWKRHEIWNRLERDLPIEKLDSTITVEPLSHIFELGEKILAGQIRGRTVIDVNA